MTSYPKLCQGPECHTNMTKDRLKGTKGSKTYQTRRRSNLLFDEFCSQNCMHDWIAQHVTRAIDHFGRTTEANHLTEEKHGLNNMIGTVIVIWFMFIVME